MAADVALRRLSPPDAERYREVRLEALRLAPEAFSSTFAQESAQPLAWFADRLGRSAMFGAFDGGELVGIAGFFVREGEKQAHKGVLVGMYVRPRARNAGVGGRLVAAVIDHARRHVEVLQLSVVAGNAPARRLYARLGFVEYGVERNALKHNGCYWDEMLMAQALSPQPTARS